MVSGSVDVAAEVQAPPSSEYSKSEIGLPPSSTSRSTTIEFAPTETCETVTVGTASGVTATRGLLAAPVPASLVAVTET